MSLYRKKAKTTLTTYPAHPTMGSDLADLDEGRPQILQNADDDLRRNAVIIILFPHNTKDLLEPSAGIRLGVLRVLTLFHQCRGDIPV